MTRRRNVRGRTWATDAEQLAMAGAIVVMACGAFAAWIAALVWGA